MMTYDKKQRDIVDATGREIAKLDGERVQGGRDVAVALADAHSRLLAQLGAIVHDVDTEIAARLKECRDALVAKADLDVSLDELQYLRENGMVGIN